MVMLGGKWEGLEKGRKGAYMKVSAKEESGGSSVGCESRERIRIRALAHTNHKESKFT